MNRKKILIVGSLKNRKIDYFSDFIICANSSLSRIDPKFDKKITHVASLNLLDPYITNKEDHLKCRRKSLLNRKPNELIIYPGPKKNYKGFLLEEIGYKPTKITQYGKMEFCRLLLRESKLSTLTYALKQKDNVLSNILRIIKYIYSGNINPYFLPSTGMLAILIAINKFGEDAQYIIDGISGKKNHNQFYYMDKLFKSDNTNKPGHTDFIILPKLLQKYNISLMQ